MVLGLIEIGFRLGLQRGKGLAESEAGPTASVIGSTLGLSAFMLAFTFGMAAARFDARREALLDEVNAIGTCYLRAELLPEPYQGEIRKRLREYIHLRAEIRAEPEAIRKTIARCEAIHDELWAQVAMLTKKDSDNETNVLFTTSLNTVIDLHTKRVVVGNYRIPLVIWLALYLVSMLSMAAVGYQFGQTRKRDLSISLILALAYSVVIYLIADLDCIDHGSLGVSQQPMIELNAKFQDTTR